MDFKLANEIYGTAWFVDPRTLMGLQKQLDYFQNGGIAPAGQAKSNSFGLLDMSSESFVGSASRLSGMNPDNVPRGTIAIYDFDSVITKNGGMSHHGTVEIANFMRKMEANDNVIGHIFNASSGGGSSVAIKYLREVSMKTVRQKPLVTYYEDINGSAMYYLSIDSDFIIAKSEDAIVGSIGTMMQTEGYKANTEDATGKRHIRIYASQSVDKNKGFEDAINDFNFDSLRNDILNPHCQEFIDDTKSLRPNVTDKHTTGAIFKSGDVVGTMIDAIGSFDDAIAKVRELAGSDEQDENVNTNTNINTNQTKNSMNNIDEFKSQHPDLYAQAVAVGVSQGASQEQSRVSSISAFAEQAPKAVALQLRSKEGLTPEFMESVSKEFKSTAFLKNAAEGKDVDTSANAAQSKKTGDEGDDDDAGNGKEKVDEFGLNTDDNAMLESIGVKI